MGWMPGGVARNFLNIRLFLTDNSTVNRAASSHYKQLDQRIVAESVAAALRPRGEDVPTPRVSSLPSDPRAAATPRPPATATSQAGKLGGYSRGWGIRGPSTDGSRPKRTWGYTFPPFPVGSGLGAMPPPAVLSTLALGRRAGWRPRGAGSRPVRVPGAHLTQLAASRCNLPRPRPGRWRFWARTGRRRPGRLC